MSLKLNSSAGGSITLNEPSTASDLTITFPANTGNVVIDSTLGTIPDMAHFAMNTTYNLPQSAITQVPYNVVLYAQNITYNNTGSTVGGIEAYHWKHTRTGFYQLIYQVRTTSDIWNMISVCKNANTAAPAGNSLRTGSVVGGLHTASCIYRVTDISDRFSLYHWGLSSYGSMAAHSGGNPASTFFLTPQAGTVATTGYYNDIIITPV